MCPRKYLNKWFIKTCFVHIFWVWVFLLFLLISINKKFKEMSEKQYPSFPFNCSNCFTFLCLIISRYLFVKFHHDFEETITEGRRSSWMPLLIFRIWSKMLKILGKHLTINTCAKWTGKYRVYTKIPSTMYFFSE